MKVLLVLSALLAQALASRLPYIVNGEDVDYPGKYPWQASLQRRGSHICGASVISKKWLITAAHCVGEAASAYSVVLGAHDIQTMREGSPARYSVKNVIMHPYYSGDASQGFPNDITLLELYDEADFSKPYLQPVTLPDLGEQFDGNPDCHITGWGNTYPFVTSPNILQELRVEVYEPSKCSSWAAGSTTYHTCIAQYGSSACFGDSGGPLVCRVGDDFKLVGVASHVFGYCSVYYPNVYTTVSYFRDWIAQISGV